MRNRFTFPPEPQILSKLLVMLRTLLILGRVSNLPTVWSNLVAGWILVGGEIDASASLGLLFAGGSCLYTGGMFLNDFCDADFDARYCPQRPIPAGKISRPTVGWIAVALFVAGLMSLASFGVATAVAGILLVGAIVLYDFRHKDVSWAPLVMGLCRALLYLVAASAMRGFEIVRLVRYDWSLYLFAGILGLYVAGITWFARGESRPEKTARWALVLLFLPALIQFGLNLAWGHPFQLAWYFDLPWLWTRCPLIYDLLLLVWIAWLLVPLWSGKNGSIGRVVSGLLAGVVLVDMIAIVGIPGAPAQLLLPFFLLALVLQRYIPAT